MKDFVYEYWSKTRLGREMLKSNNISESDLLFLIPNNVKRMHSLPATRVSGKKKRKQKEQRKRFILSFKLFDILEDIIEKTLFSNWAKDEFFQQFVDIKNFTTGDKNRFQGLRRTMNIYDDWMGEDISQI